MINLSGIDREITLITRTSFIEKHLPGTQKAESEFESEGIVHVFNDRETMERVVNREGLFVISLPENKLCSSAIAGELDRREFMLEFNHPKSR